MDKAALLDGFTERVPFGGLDLDEVPQDHGVYAVLWRGGEHPAFLYPGTGRTGSAYDTGMLERAWVPGEQVLYIGRAQCRKGIQERLRKYRRFGQGRNSGHSGGRAIWQLPDQAQLWVCWRPDTDPVGSEDRLIDGIKASHQGRRPFANRMDGTKNQSSC